MATTNEEPRLSTEPTAPQTNLHDAAAPADAMLADNEKGKESLSGQEENKEEEPEYATGLKLLILMVALLLCQFLVALDMVSRGTGAVKIFQLFHLNHST